jgi:hypothetical protein
MIRNMELHPSMTRPVPYGYEGVDGANGSWKMGRREDMAVHQGETSDVYAGSRAMVMEFTRLTEWHGCESEPQHVIEARFHSGLTLVQYLLPASDTIHVLHVDASGTRALGAIQGTLRVPTLDPECFIKKNVPGWVYKTGARHLAAGAPSVVIQGEAMTQVIHRDGSIALLPHGDVARGEPLKPFVTEDEVRTPPWMRKVDAPVAAAVMVEGAFVNVGGVRVPVASR